MVFLRRSARRRIGSSLEGLIENLEHESEGLLQAPLEIEAGGDIASDEYYEEL